MQYYEVAPVGIVRSDQATYTYHSPDILSVGSLVLISIGKKERVGIITKTVTQPSYTTKPLDTLIEPHALPRELVALSLWLAEYYSTHLGIVLQTVLPRGLTKKRRTRPSAPHDTHRAKQEKILTPDQQTALETLRTMSPGSALLHGVTGSGKTTVYIEAAKACIDSGRSVIILTPEIALTPQLVDEFSHHFDDLIVTHSRQTEAERHTAWRDALVSTTPRIVIGPRSALFMPLSSIGLIIIDEAHEPSYKQEQSPRYSALRAARILADAHQAKLIMGSATPLVSDYYLASHAARPIITMPKPARTITKPTITLVDMTKRAAFSSHRFFSSPLLEAIDTTLEAGKQTLLFHNRRGSASVTLCEQCGWQAGCPRCFVPLTLHTDTHQLRCHICNFSSSVPTSCPVCQSADIIHKGIGTKMIEAELIKRYPNKKIVRFDGDSEQDATLEKLYPSLYDGTIDIIIGTQVVAKGLDLPHLRTVGIVQADAGLSLPDYGSSERTFQLLAQAIGRVGRDNHASTIVVQSYQPSHPAIVHGIEQDYPAFYEHTLRERKRALFPPFTYLLKLTCAFKSEAAAIKATQTLAKTLRAQAPEDVSILGPTPAFYERQRDSYRWQLICKSPHRHQLQALLAHLPSTHWQYELDPLSLL